nr:hypothetical protein BOSE7B_60216 [Bosea sp. 7B]
MVMVDQLMALPALSGILHFLAKHRKHVR